MDYDPGSLSSLLPSYYRRLFPFKTYFKWLCYGQKPNAYFAYREFAFILRDDVYLRYKTFLTQAELESAVQSLCPEKIDIGPVFSHRPSEHNRVRDFAAKERELVFDIDLTDYDDVRTCCQGGAMCQKCWKFMVVAVQILDRALREDFGFKHILFVYSGRRGIHCWVCDPIARALNNDGRGAIAEYLQILSKAVEVMKPHMEELMLEQGWMASDEAVFKVIELIPEDDGFRSDIRERLELMKTPRDKWRALRLSTNFSDPDVTSRFNTPKNRFTYEEIVLQLAYPRLDINVTKGTNHLLKSPFVVHPKTGKVAVPLVAKNVHLFNADNVPKINQLIVELNEAKENAGDSKKPLDYKRTSLGDYVETFAAFVDALVKDTPAKRPADSMDF